MNSYITTVSAFTEHNLMLNLYWKYHKNSKQNAATEVIYHNSKQPLPYLSNNYRQTGKLHNGWTEFEVELARPENKRNENQKEVQKQ